MLDEIASVLAGYQAAVAAALPRAVAALAVTGVLLLLSRRIEHAVERACLRAGTPINAALVVSRLARWASVIGALLVGMAILMPSFDAAQLIQLLGVGSIAIGFAFRDILQNFLAGLLVLITEPFRIGDVVVIGGCEGKVEHIHTRATTIRRYDGTLEVIPNATVFTEPVTVLTAGDARRWEYDFTIGYGDDIELARQVVYDAIAACDLVLGEPEPEVYILELGDSGVKLRTYWWVAVPDVHPLKAWDQVVTSVVRGFADRGIDIPYTTHTVLLHDQTDEFDGDRLRQREGWPARDGDTPQPRRSEQVLARAARQLVTAGRQ